MSRLFVLNATSQNRQVYYRIDFALDRDGNRIDGRKLPPKFIEIGPGKQVPFGGEFNPVDVEKVIQQLEENAGAVSVNDIKTAKAKGVVKLVWSLDFSIPRPICEDVMAHNIGRLTEDGVERRNNMAINADYGLREIAEEDAGRHSGFTLEVESGTDLDPDYTAPPMEAGIKVVEKSNSRPRPRARRAA